MPLFQVVVALKDGEPDPIGQSALATARELGIAGLSSIQHRRVFELSGPEALTAGRAERIARELLADPIADTVTVRDLEATSLEADATGGEANVETLTVCRRAGVMDPVLLSLRKALGDGGHQGLVTHARRADRYRLEGELDAEARDRLARKVLSNPVIEDAFPGAGALPRSAPPNATPAGSATLPLQTEGKAAIEALNRSHGLALSALEILAIAKHYQDVLRRNPTVLELETVAQTWSEHCKHKTLGGEVVYQGPPPSQADAAERVTLRYDNLLKETIFEVTRSLGRDDFCLSVFVDNAGVVAFDEHTGVCMKVETHNHPSALEPYGGAGTGMGGVIRDILGTGLAARPIASTSVFCFGLPGTDPAALPQGTLHPRQVIRGVVAGVRDYGNRMGIPTVAGAVCFDARYTQNPVVYCGTVGVIPRDRIDKRAQPGDAIVLLGGRTGRDGIHGAVFSSVELTSDSEVQSSGAVQIGNPIEEKRVLDGILALRDAGLLNAVTDCGAGGLSSAVGEMGEDTGAEVWLERVPLKYEGLTSEEIWISEAQERMVLAVAPGHVDAVLARLEQEGAEACVIGRFTGDGVLTVRHEGSVVGQLTMAFLHDGLPRESRQARYEPPARARLDPARLAEDPAALLLAMLSSWDACSREAILRQYDHEVQGQSALKPYAGEQGVAPQDAAVLRVEAGGPPSDGPIKGIAIACGLNPAYGDLDPYRMAVMAVDEAVRNAVSVGADPSRLALLDNFTWGDCGLPDRLGTMVLACEGAKDAALEFGAPFISGKDSLNNEFVDQAGVRTSVPGTLLISALAIHPDIRRT
ncbi:MAG: AIR synthase-related protein, partial [Planctomycetota bacterium]